MPYDLSKAFEAIEDELIGGIIRNLGNHKAEENQLGFEWEQWQAVQIKALEDYRRKNLKKFPPRYNKLNNQIRNLLLSKYNDGQTTQERQIMQAIRRGFKSPKVPPKFTGNAKIEGDFFTVNDRKLDALIQSVTHDMERAEYAVLRLADDQYRKIIFNAQIYANTGAGTYEKAVDMAARDFLRAGVNSIEYKNGSRHTITDYADMAIKTASKRAYLQGEGKMRGEWEIYTVILNKRACPCPLCAPFVGKVFIDDVWSGGQGVAGTDYGISPVTGIKYPLLSAAIRQGLYHPRCRDVHTTYFEGISTPPEDSEYTADELDALAEKYNAEQKQNYCERQEKRYDRISKYSLDEENQRIYDARAKAFGDKAEEFKKLSDSIDIVSENSKPKITDSKTVVDNKTINSAKYRKVFDNKISILTEYEFNDITTLNMVIESIQRVEMLMKIADEVQKSIFELGTEGRLLKMQLNELTDGVEQEEHLLIKDYVVEKSEEEAFKQIRSLSYEDLTKQQIIANLLGIKEDDNYSEVTVYTRGYRILNKVPRMPNNIVENVVNKFKSFQNLLSADINELDEVDGIGEVRAKTIVQSLKRMQEQFVFDRLLI